MKLPNILSLSRIAFLFLIAALLAVPVKGLAFVALVVFLVAALTDWADGFVARRFNMITDFGKLMDALADKVLMVGMFVILLTLGDFMPAWAVFAVLIIIGREFLVTGLRLVAASRGQVLAAERGGKIKTVVQIISVSLLLLAYALRDTGLSQAALDWVYWIGLATFIAATVLTFQSGAVYLIKYSHLLQDSAGTPPNTSS